MLDFLLTKEPDMVNEVTYGCPKKSYHVMIEFKVREERDKQKYEQHRREKFNYGRAYFGNSKNFFEIAD